MIPAYNGLNLQPRPPQIGDNDGMRGIRQQLPFALAKMEFNRANNERANLFFSYLPGISRNYCQYAAIALVVGGGFVAAGSPLISLDGKFMMMLISAVVVKSLLDSIGKDTARTFAALTARLEQKARDLEVAASAAGNLEYNEFVDLMVGNGLFEKYAKNLRECRDLSKAGDALLALEEKTLLWSLSESANPEIILAPLVLATLAAVEEASDEFKKFMKDNPDMAIKTKDRLISIANESRSVADILPKYIVDGAVNPRMMGIPSTILMAAKNQ